MKFLFDQNISFRLVVMLNDLYPDSSLVKIFDLDKSKDSDIWEFAKLNRFIIESKDADFHQRSFLYGHPPKIIFLQLGNCSTVQIEQVIRKNRKVISDFEKNTESSYLVIDEI